MYCPDCGTEVEGVADFCPECGTSLNDFDGNSSTEAAGENGGGGITSKVPGMRPGSTIRNVALGAVYVVLLLAVIGAAAGPTDSADTGADGADAATGGGSTDTPASGESESGYAVRIDYDGEWSGAASLTGDGESSTESISGTGPRTIDINGQPDIISVNAQKRDGGSGTITVQIIEDGEVVSEASSSSEYGVAQTSQSFY
jgi:hypothetical protein